MKVVACVMFKNEEEILERCLSNIKQFVDGYVLMDTGSTDNSIKIASNYGKVHECEFEDFVITKNKVLDIAESQDYDIIIWMDSDEYIRTDCKKQFQEGIDQLYKSDSNILITDINDLNFNNNIVNEYIRPRAWKTKKGIKFQGPGIHEYIGFDYEKDIFRRDVKVNHKHKTKGKNYANTLDFYIETLKKYIEKEPENIRGLFYLARTYYDKQDYSNSIKYHKEYRKVSERIKYIYNEEYWYSLYEEGKCYENQEKYKDAIDIYERCIEMIPERAESYAQSISIAYYKLKDLAYAKTIGERGRHLKTHSQFNMFVDSLSYPYKILDILSLVYWDYNEYEKGLECIDELLSLPRIKDYNEQRIKYNRTFFEEKAYYKKKPYNINTYFDNIFCINLEKRKDRKDKLTPMLNTVNLNVEWFRAYDGDLLKPFVNKNVMVLRTPGYIGCLLSHLEVIKISYNRGYEKVLILEDDISIHRNLNDEFEKIINQIESNNAKWDVLYLGHASFYEPYDLGDSNGTWTSIENEHFGLNYTEAKDSWACHAYALNRKAMKEILDYYDKNGYVNELDRVLAGVYQRKGVLNFLMVYPQLFVQNDSTSDNDPTGNSADHFSRFLNKAYSTRDNYL